MSLLERFMAKVSPEPNTGCWLWVGGLRQRGYGQVRVGARMRTAHRVAWELFKGPIVAGLHVLHRCDVRPCVNPAHLFLGTHADNMRDMSQKGRAPRGERSGCAKLSAEDVRTIRRLRGVLLHRQIAAAWGISLGQVSKIQTGAQWGSA